MSLRALREDDLDELYAVVEANREHLAPWMPWAREEREATAEFLRTAVREEAEGLALHCGVIEGQRIVGVCGLHAINPLNLSAGLGYWLAAEAQGQGAAAAAVAELLDHAFGELGLHRVEVRAGPDNSRSRTLAERLGFREEARLREAERFGDTYRDLVLYALLAPEWAERPSLPPIAG